MSKYFLRKFSNGPGKVLDYMTFVREWGKCVRKKTFPPTFFLTKIPPPILGEDPLKTRVKPPGNIL